MLYLIGLGLGDEKDITLRGLEAVKKCEKVYMEAYTSLLSFGLSTDGLSTLVITLFFFPLNSELILFQLIIYKICIWDELDLQEKLYGKPITVADREMVEEKVDSVLSEATSFDVAFLVVGDPFGYFPVGFSFQFRFL